MPGTPISGCVNGGPKGSFNHWSDGVMECWRIGRRENYWFVAAAYSHEFLGSRLDAAPTKLIIIKKTIQKNQIKK